MAKDESVAPKERVNIVYQSASVGGSGEKELPFKLLVIGDFTGRNNDRMEKRPVRIDKNNFNRVLEDHKLDLTLDVPNKLAGKAEGRLQVHLTFGGEAAFRPDVVARQVPELDALLQVRDALRFLRGPLSNRRAFRQRIEQLVADPAVCQQLQRELGMEPSE